jgi:hypothetical protein
LLNIFRSDKFIIKYSLDKNKKFFREVSYENISLNANQLIILNTAMSFLKDFSLLESYEHLIIKTENHLRDYNKISYKGIIFAENLSQDYLYFKNVFKDFIFEFVKEDLKKKINFQCIDCSSEWIFLNPELKIQKIRDSIKNFKSPLIKNSDNIQFEDYKGKNEIYISINDEIEVKNKPKICLDLELYIKKNIDPGICVYFKYASDKNKGRRLKI